MKKSKKIIIPVLMAVVMGSPFVIKNVYSSIYNKLGTGTSANFSGRILQEGETGGLNGYLIGRWTKGQLPLQPNHDYELHINAKAESQEDGFLHAINVHLNSANMNLSELYVWSSTNMNVTYVNPSGDNILINDFNIEQAYGGYLLNIASDAPWYINDYSGIAGSLFSGYIKQDKATTETKSVDLFDSDLLKIKRKTNLLIIRGQIKSPKHKKIVF